MGISAAVIGGLALGTSAYSAQQQAKATKKASRTQEQQAMEARRIAAEQKPMEESATMLTDTGIGENTLGSLGLMVDPTAPKKKTTTGLATSGTTGLSTSTTTSLGFGS